MTFTEIRGMRGMPGMPMIFYGFLSAAQRNDNRICTGHECHSGGADPSIAALRYGESFPREQLV